MECKLMARIAHCLMLAAGAAVLLAQPASANERHYRHHASAYRHAAAAAIRQDVARSPLYGTFGGYA